MTGLPTALHFRISSFCMLGTFSMGTSTPRSPRATIRASLASRMLSMLSTASERSILEMISGSRPSSRSLSLAEVTFSSSVTTDRATKSASCSAANSSAALVCLAVEGLRWGPAGRRDSSLLRHPAASGHPATDGLAVDGNHL